MLGGSCIAVQLAASQEGLSSMKLVSQLDLQSDSGTQMPSWSCLGRTQTLVIKGAKEFE
jgi:hypothetical protein